MGTYADAGAAMGGKLHGAVILPSGRRHAVAHPYGANPDAEQRRIAEFDRGGMR